LLLETNYLSRDIKAKKKKTATLKGNTVISHYDMDKTSITQK